MAYPPGTCFSRRRSTYPLDSLSDQPGESADTMFMPAHLLSEFAGGGIGRMLAQAMAKDLTRRGARVTEAFGDRRWESPALSARCERRGGEP
jgi:hypothetical protein